MLTIPIGNELPAIFCKACKTRITPGNILFNKIGGKIHLLRYWCVNPACVELLQLKEINRK